MLHGLLRKCVYDGKPAYFHGWYQVAYPIDPSPFKGGHPGGQMCYPVAIVELEDGTMVRASEAEITFQNHPTDEQLFVPHYTARRIVLQEEGASR